VIFTVVCPYCYHKINRKRLWFVCSGRPAPGYRACVKEVNDRRLGETAYREQMFPTFAPPLRWWFSPRKARCPGCNAESGEHVCPCCNTPLPANFGDGWSPVIAMVGARATGKTIYLTVLANQIQDVLRERFEADVWLFGDEARQQLAANEQMLFEDRELPALTQRPVDGRSEPLVFEWRRRHGPFGRFGSSYLSFLDTAGESLGTESGVAELQYLKNMDAMIVLLDPYSLPRVRERLNLTGETPRAASNALTVLGQVTQHLRKQEGLKSNQRLAKPIAVAFAKFDLLTDTLREEDRQTLFRPETDDPWYDETAGRAMHETMRELILDWEAGIDRHLHSHYETYQYFALSSLGRPPDLSTNKVSEKGIRPSRVPDPLEWLLSRYKLVPRKRSHV
jgi:hypothetical protein